MSKEELKQQVLALIDNDQVDMAELEEYINSGGKKQPKGIVSLMSHFTKVIKEEVQGMEDRLYTTLYHRLTTPQGKVELGEEKLNVPPADEPKKQSWIVRLWQQAKEHSKSAWEFVKRHKNLLLLVAVWSLVLWVNYPVVGAGVVIAAAVLVGVHYVAFYGLLHSWRKRPRSLGAAANIDWLEFLKKFADSSSTSEMAALLTLAAIVIEGHPLTAIALVLTVSSVWLMEKYWKSRSNQAVATA
jgi:hypothetical protein